MPRTIIKTWDVNDWKRSVFEKELFKDGYYIASESDVTETKVSAVNTCCLWVLFIPILLIIAWPLAILVAILLIFGGRATYRKVKVMYRLDPNYEGKTS